MSVYNVYGARRADEVMNETWGHLAPEAGQVYTGSVEFTLGCFRDLAVITAEFAGLPDSPWFYDGLHDWLLDQQLDEGKVYRFTGTYSPDRTEPFVGELRILSLDGIAGELVNP